MNEKVIAHRTRKTPPYTFLEFGFSHSSFQHAESIGREKVNGSWLLAKRKKTLDLTTSKFWVFKIDRLWNRRGQTYTEQHEKHRHVLVCSLIILFWGSYTNTSYRQTLTMTNNTNEYIQEKNVLSRHTAPNKNSQNKGIPPCTFIIFWLSCSKFQHVGTVGGKGVNGKRRPSEKNINWCFCLF